MIDCFLSKILYSCSTHECSIYIVIQTYTRGFQERSGKGRQSRAVFGGGDGVGCGGGGGEGTVMEN